jgi:hypothetical protein
VMKQKMVLLFALLLMMLVVGCAEVSSTDVVAEPTKVSVAVAQESSATDTTATTSNAPEAQQTTSEGGNVAPTPSIGENLAGRTEDRFVAMGYSIPLPSRFEILKGVDDPVYKRQVEYNASAPGLNDTEASYNQTRDALLAQGFTLEIDRYWGQDMGFTIAGRGTNTQGDEIKVSVAVTDTEYRISISRPAGLGEGFGEFEESLP